MKTGVMTFILKGYYQFGIHAVGITGKHFSIWLSSKKVMAIHKCLLKWSVCSRTYRNNLLFAFTTLCSFFSQNEITNWLNMVVKSPASPFTPWEPCRIQAVHTMSRYLKRELNCMLCIALVPSVFLLISDLGLSKCCLESWGLGHGKGFLSGWSHLPPSYSS
jgi:hypothetical protein